MMAPASNFAEREERRLRLAYEHWNRPRLLVSVDLKVYSQAYSRGWGYSEPPEGVEIVHVIDIEPGIGPDLVVAWVESLTVAELTTVSGDDLIRYARQAVA